LAAAGGTTEGPPGDPPPPNGPRRPRWQTLLIYGGAVIALLVLGALIAEFAPLGRGESNSTTTSAPDVTAVIPKTTTTTTTVPEETTTTTQATTTTSTTTTTTTTTTLPPFDAIEPPIPIEELTMRADGLGAQSVGLRFGADGLEVIGRLVASLGQPNEDTGVVTSVGEFGTCPDDSIRSVRFGSLIVTNLALEDGGETFVGYRLDLDFSDEPSPADAMTTLSGLKAGDTVADLKATYAGFDLEFPDGDEGIFFELRGSGGDLLLWGPVTSADDDGIVRGVYAPDSCEDSPRR